MKVAFFTICAKNYLAYARTLMSSLQNHYFDDASYHVILSDEINSYFDPKEESFSVIESSDYLGSDELRDMTFRYDITEFSTAVKPKAFLHLFEAYDYDVVVYLDPDILVLNKLEDVELAFSNGVNAVVTPHICKPLEDGKKPDDQSMLQAGIYNFGFVALAKSEDTKDFLEWWHRRLRRDCRSDLKEGLFVDQKWGDLLPCFIEKTKILRHPGYNVAYWNLLHRTVCYKNEKWFSNDEKLVFFHFSGSESPDPKVFSKHQSRFDVNNIGGVKILLEKYRLLVLANGKKELSAWPYAYGLHGGIPIPTLIRRIYREQVEPNKGIQSNPFEITVDYCKEIAPELPDYDFEITRLMHSIWLQRMDLQKAFDLSTADGQLSFVNWFFHSASRELKLDEVFYLKDKIKKK